VIAEIGIVLLLFEVGLDTDIGQLVKEGVRSMMVAVTGVALPGAAGYLAAKAWLGMGTLPALFMGGTIVATSIGITVRVFRDLGKQNSRMARVVLGAAVLDDVIGVVVLAVLYDLAVGGTVSVIGTVRILAFIGAFLLLAPILARLFVPLLAKLVAHGRTKGMVPTLVTCMILALAVAAHAVGAPEILGSFAAGIALARSSFLPLGPKIELHSKELAERIDESMKPITDLFVPVFFVMVGVSIDLSLADPGSGAFWGVVAVLTAVAVLAKIASGIWAEGGWREKLATGIAMVPRGEVGLIFAEVGKRSSVFDDRTYAAAVFIVAFSTLLGPLALRGVLGRGKRTAISDDMP
jgi:Kef-type K+ transport system membrane component KefB